MIDYKPTKNEQLIVGWLRWLSERADIDDSTGMIMRGIAEDIEQGEHRSKAAGR